VHSGVQPSRAFVKAGLKEKEAEELTAYYIDGSDRLHGVYFYDLLYEEEEHKPLMEKAKWYVDLAERARKSGKRLPRKSLNRVLRP